MPYLHNNTRKERKQNPELQSIPIGELFSCIGMDFKELDGSFNNTHFSLVFQDHPLKWPEVHAVVN